MTTGVHMWRIGIFCLIALGAITNLKAQQAIFTAAASAPKIGIKDQLQVDYTIQNIENLRSITEPTFKDFQVVGGPFQRQSSNISITNGKMTKSVSVTFSYVLQPKKTGKLSVPAATVKDADGKSYESNGLEIDVVDGSLARQTAPNPYDDPFAAIMQRRRQAMQQRMQQAEQRAQEEEREDINKQIFIKVSVDKQKAYLGEQITASYKLYTRIPMNVGISKLPSLNGFWTQDFERPGGNIKPQEEIIDGKRYQVFLLKKSALFPQQTGTLTLDPAEAEGTARIMRKVRQRDPFAAFFDNDPFFQQFGSLMMSDPFFNDDFFHGMSYQDVPVQLKSSPVKIEVLPVPEKDKPKEYGNAVGQFTLHASVDKTELTTDDALTYTLKIEGTGNFKLITPPSLELPNGLSTYDPHILDTITGRSTTITGSKIITYVISPNVAGTYEIPSVPFSYYDPKTGTYHTLHTDPVKINVTHGKNAIASHTQTGTGLTDIHPVITKPLTSYYSKTKPIFFTIGYWSLYALPLMAMLGYVAWKRKEEEEAKDVVKFRSKRANKVALKRLSLAKKYVQQNNQKLFYEEISKAIWLYLSDKLNIPLASLSKETAEEALLGKNIPSSLMDAINGILQTCETALYASYHTNTAMQDTYQNAVNVLSQLEEKL